MKHNLLFITVHLYFLLWAIYKNTRVFVSWPMGGGPWCGKLTKGQSHDGMLYASHSYLVIFYLP